MKAHLNATENFFLAAKRSEIATLEQLVTSSELVTKVCDLIHELQRERGLSNVYLVSAGKRFCEQRSLEIQAGQVAEAALRHYLERLDPDRGPLSGSSRLFSNIAYVLHALDHLPELRVEIGERRVSAPVSTRSFCRLIAGLLAVVFEAADISGDPEITRALVAMFNFMQGKEYAGQERAWGAIGFAAGTFEPSLLERLSHLLDAQQHSLELFTDFATAGQIDDWRRIEDDDASGELNRLRNVIHRSEAGGALPPAISEVWYDLTTLRIDRMQQLERRLSSSLLRLSQQRLQQACAELKGHHHRLETLAAMTTPLPSPLTLPFDSEDATPDASGGPSATRFSRGGNPELIRSLYGLVKEQSERLQRMGDELTEARQALTERKRIERAKGLLMQHQGVTEEQAYALLRQASMLTNRRMIDIAEDVIDGNGRLRHATPVPSSRPGS